jgi:predicted AAA+ superfamily ATPase
MSSFPRLLQLHELAVAEGRRLPKRRELFARLAAQDGRHFIGIVGPRGAGKSVLLKQWAAADEGAIYLSADTLGPGADLFALVKGLAEIYRFRIFLVDEVHFLPDVTAALKQIYDFLEVRVIFTSSVAVALQSSAHDLARRVRLHTLDYFSLREYLSFRRGEELPALDFEALLKLDFSPAHLRAGAHFAAYLAGGLLPFALDEPDPLPLLAGTLDKIIERDIPATLRLHLDEIPILRKLLAFIGRSGVDGINYSSLAANLGITKYKAEQYSAAFESAFVLRRIFPAGTNLLREPKVLLVPPVRLLHRPPDEVVGGLREDFFALAMRQANLDIHYLKSPRGGKTPDFLVDHHGQRIVFEIGGRGKGRSQFKNITADRKIVLAPDIQPAPDRLPLHLIGLLADGTDKSRSVGAPPTIHSSV